MKRILMLVSLLALVCAGISAQGLVIGAKVPDFRVREWLSEKKPASHPRKMTLIEFFHSSNPASVRRLATLNEWAAKYPEGLTVVVITKEDSREVREMLGGCLSLCCVGIDDGGKTFESFGAQYVPFGVLTDPKSRVLWMGNSSGMKEEEISNHIENGIYKDRPLRKAPQGRAR